MCCCDDAPTFVILSYGSVFVIVVNVYFFFVVGMRVPCWCCFDLFLCVFVFSDCGVLFVVVIVCCVIVGGIVSRSLCVRVSV